MKKLLCATDLSPRGDLAVDRAADLARHFGAELRLLHVVDEDQPREIVEAETQRARVVLQESVARMRDPVPGLQCDIETGSVFDTIVKAAQKWNADLLVLGTHRRRLLRDVVVGTTIERVMRTGQHPVLMVNAATFVRYETVLLALDTSEASASAVRAAKALGLLDNIRISVVHAFEPIYKGMLSWAGVRDDTVTEYSANWERQAGEEIRTFLSELGLDGDAAHVVLAEGSPFPSIKRTVERLRPHLLVVGTHGRTGLARALLGSVAERVLSEIECDILAVPRPSV
jgi:universal stress protein E